MEDSFRHEALFYSGEDGFLRGTLPFVAEALRPAKRCSWPSASERATLLQRALANDASRVRFVDMQALGRNPARVIPAWREFLREHADDEHPVRGIGEPVWPGRSERRARRVRAPRVAAERRLRVRARVEPAVPV